MTADSLQAIHERLNAATPGPWKADKRGLPRVYRQPARQRAPLSFDPPFSDIDYADAEFIAHAREDVGALLAVAEAAEAFANHPHIRQFSRLGGGDLQPLRAALARLREGEPDA